MAVTEIVSLKVAPGVSEERFIAIVDELEMEFHSKLPGFLDSELLRDEKSGEWLIVQHWVTLDELRAASKSMFESPLTEVFRGALIPSSVSMRMLPQLKVWGSAQ